MHAPSPLGNAGGIQNPVKVMVNIDTVGGNRGPPQYSGWTDCQQQSTCVGAATFFPAEGRHLMLLGRR